MQKIVGRFCKLFLGISLLLPGIATSAATDMPNALSLGVFPYFDATTLAKLHKPLKQHLSNASGQPIRMVTAPSFSAFKQRTAQARYDIIVTAPHLGRMAEKEAGYEWLAFTSNQSRAIFLTHERTGIETIADLKGTTLALPPKPAIIHQLALTQLEKHALRPHTDVTIRPRRSHSDALYMVIRGVTDAAAVGGPTWNRYAAPEKAQLKKIGESGPIPGFAIMVHPRIASQIRTALREALFEFPGTAPGESYFDSTGLEGIRKPENADFELLDHYLAKIAEAGKAGD